MSTEEASVQELFFRRRTVVLGEDIGLEMIRDVVMRLIQLQAESSDRINLIINSAGGELGVALNLCDVLEHILTAPVRGIALGECSSAATFVLLHCAERVCTPYAQFKIHSGTISGVSFAADHTTSANLGHLLAETEATVRRVTDLYARKLGINEQAVTALMARGDQPFHEFLTAEEAVGLGLVQEIVRGKLDIFPASS